MAEKYLLISIMALVFLTGCKKDEIEKIIVYKKGTPQLVTDQKTFNTIKEQVFGYLNNINDVMQIILTPSQINEAIGNEDGLEVIFTEKQKTHRLNNKHSISFTKLYIPFSGKYTKFGTVIFFGKKEGYGSLPPYITTEKTTKIEAILSR